MFNRICENCKKKIATERHHLFSQKEWARKIYGKLLDDERNIQYLCYDCHHNKPLKKFNEARFCEVMNIKPRSKELK